jgi:phage I-like protein
MPVILASDRKISLELNGSQLEWLPLHPAGNFIGNGQEIIFDETSVAALGLQLLSAPTGTPLDYHHATLKVEEGTADKAPRAAQIVGFEIREGYVYGRAADWVQSAFESVKIGEFGYVSSVLNLDAQNRVVGYHSHALTNKPGTFNQRRIGLESDQKGKHMEELLKLLGLAPDATPEALRLALESLNSRAAFGDALAGILALEAKNTPEARAKAMKLVALEQIGEKLDAARVALEAQTTQAQAEKVETIIKIALEQGRIFEPERVLWEGQLEKDFGAAKIALEAMPRRVPTTIVIPAESSQKVALEDSQANVNRMFGVSTEAFTKYGGA